MFPENTILYLLWACPILFKTKADVLEHLFFVLGNGYEWVEGELICRFEACLDQTPRGIYNAVRKRYKKRRREDVVHIRKIKKAFEPLIEELEQIPNLGIDLSPLKCREPEPLPKKPTKEAQTSLKIERKQIYPISRSTHIVNIPDNVKPEWLALAKEALIVAQQLKRTEQDDKWLEKAKKHIKKLEKS